MIWSMHSTQLQLFLRYSVEIYKYTNASELISGLTYGLATLVGVHIATEVLETVHPGVTGLYFIIMVYGTPKFQQYNYHI